MLDPALIQARVPSLRVSVYSPPWGTRTVLNSSVGSVLSGPAFFPGFGGFGGAVGDAVAVDFDAHVPFAEFGTERVRQCDDLAGGEFQHGAAGAGFDGRGQVVAVGVQALPGLVEQGAADEHPDEQQDGGTCTQRAERGACGACSGGPPRRWPARRAPCRSGTSARVRSRGPSCRRSGRGSGGSLQTRGSTLRVPASLRARSVRRCSRAAVGR